jgi:hypothetical protein
MKFRKWLRGHITTQIRRLFIMSGIGIAARNRKYAGKWWVGVLMPIEIAKCYYVSSNRMSARLR